MKEMSSLLDLSSLVSSLSSPVPTALNTAGLLPAAHLTAEHELARNPDQLSRWFSYINTIKEEVLSAELDARGVATPEQQALLGQKLSTAAGRRGLQRLIDIYERALARFPNEFSLWKDYLAVRHGYVLGKATLPLNLGAPKRKKSAEPRTMVEFLQAGKGDHEPLAEGERDVESSWEGALDGVVGWEEWRSLAAVHERSLMWLPNVCPYPRTV